MYMKMIFVSFFLTLIFMAGCSSSPYHSALSNEDRTHLFKKVKVVSVIPNKQIKVQYVPSAEDAGGYAAPVIGIGIVGMIVQDAIAQERAARKAEHKARGFRKQLSSYDFKQKVHSAYAKVLHNEDWLGITDFVKDPVYKRFDADEFTNNLDEEKILLLSTHYSFDPDLNIIHVSLNSTLYLKDTGRVLKQKKVYKSKSWTLVHQSPGKFLQYSYKTPTTQEQEINRLKQDFSKKIAQAESKNAQKLHELTLTKKLREVKKRPYSILSPPPVQFLWDRENMIKHLNYAAENLAKQLVNTLKSNLLKKSFKEQSVKIPIINTRDTLERKLYYPSRKVYVLDEDLDTGYITYLTNDGVTYSLPKNELIKTRGFVD